MKDVYITLITILSLAIVVLLIMLHNKNTLIDRWFNATHIRMNQVEFMVLNPPRIIEDNILEKGVNFEDNTSKRKQ